MRFRGHPWLGAVSGLFLGAGVAMLLQQFAVRPIDNLSFFGLPLLGVVLGLGMAAWAPLGRRGAEPAVPIGPVAPTTPSAAPRAPEPASPPTFEGPAEPPPPPTPPPPPSGA
jgi:hypothetical protein